MNKRLLMFLGSAVSIIASIAIMYKVAISIDAGEYKQEPNEEKHRSGFIYKKADSPKTFFIITIGSSILSVLLLGAGGIFLVRAIKNDLDGLVIEE